MTHLHNDSPAQAISQQDLEAAAAAVALKRRDVAVARSAVLAACVCGNPQFEVYRAMYNYTARDDDELSFKKHDRLLIQLKKSRFWWAGSLLCVADHPRFDIYYCPRLRPHT
jgi:uncharacterized protein (DUF2147 family)